MKQSSSTAAPGPVVATKRNPGAIRRFIELGAAEPYRIFFPFGLILGLVGVSLWPLYFADWIRTYPAIPHARLMIEGMMAAFIFGFLATAGPRLTETRRFSPWESVGLLALQAAATTAHLAGHVALGDAAFLVALIAFLQMLGGRFAARRDLPPPNFVLVFLGLLSAFFGTAILLCDETILPSPWWHRFGGSLLNQGFVVFPILGAGAFLLRKFLDLEAGGDEPVMRNPSPEWRIQSGSFATVGAIIIFSFALEAADLTRLGALIRAAATAWYLYSATPWLRPRGGHLANCLRFGLVALVLAPLTLAVFPFRPVAALHVLFLAGYSVAVFAVATRVIFGHSGQSHRFRGSMPFLLAVVGLLAFALLTRLGAEFGDQSRAEHLVMAAVIWLAASALWGWRLLPHVVTPDKT